MTEGIETLADTQRKILEIKQRLAERGSRDLLLIHQIQHSLFKIHATKLNRILDQQ